MLRNQPERALRRLRHVPGAISAVLAEPNTISEPDDTTATHIASPSPGPVPRFCNCGRCSKQSVGMERQCCRLKKGPCILLNDDMVWLINPTVVQVAVSLDYSNLCEDHREHNNNNMHHAAYRQFVLFVAGNTGRHCCMVIPLCVTWAIHGMWPSEDGAYRGFQQSD